MFNLVFFAALRERLGQSQMQWPVRAACVSDLIAELQAQGEPWQSALARPDLLCARNQAMCNRNTEIKDGDEIAFFPPVTGG